MTQVMNHFQILLPLPASIERRTPSKMELVDHVDIGGELEELWEKEDRYLILIWNGYAVNIELRYDFSYLFECFLALYEWVISEKIGPKRFDLCVSSFHFSIVAKKIGDSIDIVAEWDVANTNVNCLDKKVIFDTEIFTKELFKAVKFVKMELTSAGLKYPWLDEFC